MKQKMKNELFQRGYKPIRLSDRFLDVYIEMEVANGNCSVSSVTSHLIDLYEDMLSNSYNQKSSDLNRMSAISRSFEDCITHSYFEHIKHRLQNISQSCKNIRENLRTGNPFQPALAS